MINVGILQLSTFTQTQAFWNTDQDVNNFNQRASHNGVPSEKQHKHSIQLSRCCRRFCSRRDSTSIQKAAKDLTHFVQRHPRKGSKLIMWWPTNGQNSYDLLKRISISVIMAEKSNLRLLSCHINLKQVPKVQVAEPHKAWQSAPNCPKNNWSIIVFPMKRCHSGRYPLSDASKK